MPSSGIGNGEFIGLLGTIAGSAEGAIGTITGCGNFERFAPPPPHPSTMPSCSLDLIADHLILAHSPIKADGGGDALPDLRAALFEIGRALATRTQERTQKPDRRRASRPQEAVRERGLVPPSSKRGGGTIAHQ